MYSTKVEVKKKNWGVMLAWIAKQPQNKLLFTSGCHCIHGRCRMIFQFVRGLVVLPWVCDLAAPAAWGSVVWRAAPKTDQVGEGLRRWSPQNRSTFTSQHRMWNSRVIPVHKKLHLFQLSHFLHSLSAVSPDSNQHSKLIASYPH